MAATCIVCGEPAGSKEHRWPAVLGERLPPYHGMLGVMPDNDKQKCRTLIKVPVPGGNATVDMSEQGLHKRARRGLDISDLVTLVAHGRAKQGEADGPCPPACIMPAVGKAYFSLGDRWSLAGATYVAQTLFASANVLVSFRPCWASKCLAK